MCWNKEVSLSTFALISIICYGLWKRDLLNDRMMAIFIMGYGSMQLAETIIWIGLENNNSGINKFGTILACLILYVQPLAFMMGIKYDKMYKDIVNDKDLYHQIFQLHDHGRDTDGEVRRWGRNSRLDNIQAAILSYKLKTYDKVIARRREVAQMYQERLGGIEELQLPAAPSSTSDNFDVYQNYELTADNRDELKAFLSEKNIGTLIQWGGKAVHQFTQLGFNQVLPDTERFFERCIMLPMNVFISDTDIDYICESVTKFYRKC